MMSHCAIQKRDVCEEMVVCPKPIRAGVLHSLVAHPFIWNLSHPNDFSESSAGNDLLDILFKGGGSHDLDSFCTQVGSPPPFFSGSPPSRVSNPLIQDSRFKEEKIVSSQLQFSITEPTSPSSYSRKGGYARTNFGNNPVVRIEGFASMNGNGRNSAVSARA